MKSLLKGDRTETDAFFCFINLESGDRGTPGWLCELIGGGGTYTGWIEPHMSRYSNRHLIGCQYFFPAQMKDAFHFALNQLRYSFSQISCISGGSYLILKYCILLSC